MQLMSQCDTSKPIIPFTVTDEASQEQPGMALMESQSWHDLPAFYELATPLINNLPNSKKPIEILYFASGEHVAPIEMALQILERTVHKKVHFTYTEIEPKYYDKIKHELAKLERNGLKLEGEVWQRPDNIYEERIIKYSYRTQSGQSGEIKHLSITFVLGRKLPNGDFPPYFRKQDFAAADVVLAFDAEDADLTTRYLSKAVKAGQTRDKILIIENRPEYERWTRAHGDIV